MTKFITQKDQIITQMRAELLATATEDRYYTEENITDCNTLLEAFLAQLERLTKPQINRPTLLKLYKPFANNSLLSTTLRKRKCLNIFGGFFTMVIR